MSLACYLVMLVCNPKPNPLLVSYMTLVKTIWACQKSAAECARAGAWVFACVLPQPGRVQI